MDQWFCLVSWRLFDVWTSLFGIMNQYDPTFDLKIIVGHCDLYFMVHWFCVISRRLPDVWTSLFGIMNQYDPMFDLKMIIGHCDLYFMGQWFWVILYLDDYLMYKHHTSGLLVSMIRHLTSKSLWSIFYGPVILPYILKTIWCMYIVLWDYKSVWP